MEKETENFIKEKLKLKIKVKRAKWIVYRGRRQGVVAELGSSDEKREIMWRKKELERDVYIDDDLTKKEREKKQRLRERIAGAEKPERREDNGRKVGSKERGGEKEGREDYG